MSVSPSSVPAFSCPTSAKPRTYPLGKVGYGPENKRYSVSQLGSRETSSEDDRMNRRDSEAQWQHSPPHQEKQRKTVQKVTARDSSSNATPIVEGSSQATRTLVPTTWHGL
ncbi:hypothetical protein E1B28_000550 [Marasmius oreades]|uniref:Uncharacterized protein n=1 Tax=Marasmius oreades TaxID=181124 RepID=A0A9P7V1R7_9AGAR|nr:uncharacterized protein E1B28_000550 [Marasmius oreades]KAG7098632.1 hypothetical protein E1B28_000550 [Marasmius oreades]